ncbi:MAG TPA: hypothetical protein VJC07_01795 [Candidatus Nanoarchaeia archaeon]|nr:hypothetical protein [Candidatus Nanoarchaeia archaeon]
MATLECESRCFVSLITPRIAELILAPSGASFFGSLKKMSIGKERMKNSITEGNNVSALGAAENNATFPWENGSAITNPVICPK